MTGPARSINGRCTIPKNHARPVKNAVAVRFASRIALPLKLYPLERN